MNKIIDYVIDDSSISDNMVVISVNNNTINSNNLKIIKCYSNYDKVNELLADNNSILKLNKTFWLNCLNLTTVHLSNNNILKFPKHMFSLKQLKHLYLDSNKISIIPPSIVNFALLETLSIENNNIELFPNSLNKLNKLKTLKLTNNKIRIIPIEIGLMKSLTALHLCGNNIEALPTTMCNLCNLTDIQFEWISLLLNKNGNDISNSLQKIYRVTFDLFKSSLQKKELYCDFKMFINAHFEKSDGIQLVNCIYEAIENNYINIMNVLLKEDNNISQYILYPSFNHKKSPFLHALSIENRTTIAKLLYNNISDDDIISLSKKEKINLLSKAIKNTHIWLIQNMLDNNQIFLTSSDLISDIGMTPFHYLFSNFNHNISLNRVIGELLFEHSDNKLLNAYNNEHWGAIHVAVRRGSIKCIEWILQKNNEKKDNKKFSLNLKGKDNWTPLHLTANSGNVILTSLLLKNDANVFARTITNKTPRDVCNNNKQIYKLLLLYENTLLNERYIVPFNNIDNKTSSIAECKKHKMLYTPSRANINFYKEIFINKESSMFEISEAICNLTSTMLKPVGKKVSHEEYLAFVEKTLNEIDLKYIKNYIIVSGINEIAICLNIVKIIGIYDKFLKQKKLCYIIKNELKRGIKVLSYINKISSLPKPKNPLISSVPIIGGTTQKKKKLNVISLTNFTTTKNEIVEPINDSLENDLSSHNSPKISNLNVSRSRNITSKHHAVYGMNVSNDLIVASKFDMFHNNVPLKSSRGGFNVTNESCNVQDSSASIVKVDSVGMVTLNLNK